MSAPAAASWYVYWRTRAEDLVVASAAVRAWQRSLLERAPGLQASLWQSEDTGPAGEATLMEVYAGLPTGLADEVAAGTPTTAWRVGARHVERFVPAPGVMGAAA